jgi:hypothetical protein
MTVRNVSKQASFFECIRSLHTGRHLPRFLQGVHRDWALAATVRGGFLLHDVGTLRHRKYRLPGQKKPCAKGATFRRRVRKLGGQSRCHANGTPMQFSDLVESCLVKTAHRAPRGKRTKLGRRRVAPAVTSLTEPPGLSGVLRRLSIRVPHFSQVTSFVRASITVTLYLPPQSDVLSVSRLIEARES